MRARAALGGFALAASAGWSLANVGAVAQRTSAAYGVALFVVGLFTTALVLTHAAMQIPAGRLCDRFGARIVGAAGLVVILLASLAGLTLREAWFAIASGFVAGFGLAAAFVGGADYVRATLALAARAGLLRRGLDGVGRPRARARPALARLARAVCDGRRSSRRSGSC